jgi:hypothetical protein
MRITSGGKVGIGTTNPASKLEVTDTGPGGLIVNIVNAGTGITNLGGFQINNTNATTNNRAGFGFADTAGFSNWSAGLGVQMTDRTNHYGDFAFATRSAAGFLERMRITSAGNIGIGITSPTALLNLKS